MYSRRVATVCGKKKFTEQCELLDVCGADGEAKALNYLPLTGTAAVGDQIVMNTTAVDLRLGTGGYHFVCLNLSHQQQDCRAGGHIMKMRYTPQQLCVLSVEEENSPHHLLMKEAVSLDGLPVLVAELHSMLAPVALVLKQKKPHARLAYVMTDGGALPAFFSKTLAVLKERELICGTITTGHAFGGDLEAVNVYSGLLAARHIMQADAVMVSMGPGVVGTGTPYGFSGVEVGDNLNRVRALEGRPVALPRISFADARERHRGLSHHTITALMDAALITAEIPLPVFADEEKNKHIFRQIAESGIAIKHSVISYENLSLECLEREEAMCKTMGRTLYEDAEFFLAAVAAAHHLSGICANKVSECVVG